MHKAKACVITCIDFRFQEAVQNFLIKEKYLGTCDEIIVAGASRDFVEPVAPVDGDYVWKQLEISLKLHSPEEIILIDHQDCGGYAQDKTIAGGLPEAEDLQAHREFLEKFREKFQKKYPQVKLLVFYINLNKEIKRVF